MTQFDCTDIKAMLSAIVDDQLDADQRHQVERHLVNCKLCRKLLDEAEAVDALLALDIGAPRLALPAGFEEAVLARTVQPQTLRFRDRRIVTFGGWLASAAAIALAMTIWIVDRRDDVRFSPLMPGTGPAEIAPNPMLSYASNVTNSWIYEGPVDVTAASTAEEAEEPAGPPEAIERIMQATIPSREDAETMYAAALALDRLRGANERSFGEIDVVRRIVEYDELLERLASAHQRLTAEDRAAVLAVESIFTRITRGPLSGEDIAEIGATIDTLELSERLARIGRRSDATLSL